MTVMTTPAQAHESAVPAAAPTSTAPLLLTLAWSLNTSGVTTWAARLVNALADRGRDVTFLYHPDRSAHAELPIAFHPKVSVVRASDLPPLRSDEDALHRFIPRYRDLIARMADRAGSPVVVSPNDFESSYGILGAISMQEPDLVRVIGWQHTDTEYATRVQLGYEPMLQAMVGVSGHIGRTLRERLPHRAGDIHELPYGVPVPPIPVRRDRPQRRPLRLIYTGRMDHQQKRITALIHLSDELERRGIDHRLQLLGDGPASDMVDRACSTRPFVRRLPAVPPEQVLTLLDRADAFVLGSGFEGLSVSMIEAMARGCVPIVTAVRSGASQAVEDGVSGFLTSPGPEADEPVVGRALADAVERYLAADPRQLSLAAWETARARFSMEVHAAAAERVFAHAAAAAPRPWPATTPCMFSAPNPGAQAVPGYAPDRLRRLLRMLVGKRVAFHATGRHTIELAPVLARSPATIVGFIDDDPALHGTRLWGWPIASVERAAADLGASDVIISSWMFQESIYEKTRAIYERQGITLHRLYADSSLQPASTGVTTTPKVALEDDPRWQALAQPAATRS